MWLLILILEYDKINFNEYLLIVIIVNGIILVKVINSMNELNSINEWGILLKFLNLYYQMIFLLRGINSWMEILKF